MADPAINKCSLKGRCVVQRPFECVYSCPFVHTMEQEREGACAMKKETIRWLCYFAAATLAGCGLHFLYDWLPNLLFALISPVRESVWEHLKIVYWPLLAAGLLMTRREQERRRSWYLALLIASAMLLIFGWVYNIRMGQESMPITITAYVLIMAVGFASAAWIPVGKRWSGGVMLAAFLLGAAIIAFTFWTPGGLLFADLSLADALYTLPC